MGLLNNLFGRSKPTINEILSTGELNWRLKPVINATKEFPNFLKCISKLENEFDIQFGIQNDISDEVGDTLLVKNVIYDKKGTPFFFFIFMFQFYPQVGPIFLTGMIVNFYKPKEMKEETVVNLPTGKKDDLTIEEYEKHYWELLNQSLAIQGFNPNEYTIKRANGQQCMNKIIEQFTRDQNK